MIYTVTLNPSLDYIVEVNQFRPGETNRTSYEQMLPGGKGINVSLMLRHLGIESTALGFLAGFVGKEVKRLLENESICTDFLELKEGCSRINVKLRNVQGTEINGMGPVVPKEKIKELLARIKHLKNGDSIVLAGSVPKSLPGTIYMDILSELKEKRIATIVDTTGDMLLRTLPQQPFLIKPNHKELGELFGVEFHQREEVIPYAKRLKELGAHNVLVSMAGNGAVLAADDGRVYECDAPHGRVINAVGAGDSMVAGFLYGWESVREYEAAFFYGLAAGSASAFSDGLATKEEVERIYRTIK